VFSRGGWTVREHLHLFRAALAGIIVAALAGTATAQVGRVVGLVRDERGQPIKGATVAAENPEASPKSLTATTDGKGRFAMIGLRSGQWSLAAKAPGFDPESGRLQVRAAGTPSVTFTLQRERIPPPSAIGGMAAKDLQTDLQTADQLYNAKRWDDAIQKYQALLAKAPALSVINLQIGQAYRNKAGDLRAQDPKADTQPVYDQALWAYQALLRLDPNSDKAKIGVGMTNLEKGDLEAAEKTLDEASLVATATGDVFYNLGEVKTARGKNDDATKAYERAAKMDPYWGKPMFALGKAALGKGDKDGAIRYFEKVVAVDPMSLEAVQSQTMVSELKK
jgi:tetratricopeptide (TPR) repeat protein